MSATWGGSDAPIAGKTYGSVGEPTLTATLGAGNADDILICHVVGYIDEADGTVDTTINMVSSGWTVIADEEFSQAFGTPPRELVMRLFVAWRVRGSATDIELSVTAGEWFSNSTQIFGEVWKITSPDQQRPRAFEVAPPFPSGNLPMPNNNGRSGLAILLAAQNSGGAVVTGDTDWTDGGDTAVGADALYAYRAISTSDTLADIVPTYTPGDINANGIVLSVGLFIATGGLFPQVIFT